jgi:four helix bundle protein
MTKDELRKRTKQFAHTIISIAEQIPETITGTIIARQIIRSGTSTGANYRAACRAKSAKDFLNKILIVEEEADETLYWLELLQERQLIDNVTVLPAISECNELVALFTAIGKTTRNNLNNGKGL